MIRSLRLLSLTLAAACATGQSSAADWEGAHVEQALVDASPISPAHPIVAMAVSATRSGCRVAKVEGNPLDGFSVRVDGIAGPRWTEIGAGTPVFSANGASVAYAARRGIEWRWVVNGVEETAYPEMTATSFAFSADGKHHAYIASPSFRRPVLVVDGVARASSGDGIFPWDATPVFSPDGSVLAWVEWMRSPQQMRVNFTGRPKPEPWVEAISLCSLPNFGALGAAGAFPGMAGAQTQPAGFHLAFSADGKHLAYNVGHEGAWHGVIDGKPAKEHQEIGFDFVFTPDGGDYAYMVLDAAGRFIIRGKDRPLPIDDINDWTLTFSPDGRHLAFAGRRGGVFGIYLDGKPAPSDVPIVRTKSQGAIYFSPDSKRLTFGIESKSALHWVVDGKAGPGCTTALGQFDFSPDSAHYTYVLPQKESKDFAIVVDGKVRAAYPIVACGPVFRSDGTLEFLAEKDHALSRFQVTGY